MDRLDFSADGVGALIARREMAHKGFKLGFHEGRLGQPFRHYKDDLLQMMYERGRQFGLITEDINDVALYVQCRFERVIP